MTVFLGAEPVSEKPTAEPTRAQLVKLAEGLGIEVPSKATKAQIEALIAEAEGE